MKKGEVAVIGIGESDSSDRVNEAVRQALTHPLLDVDYRGANGALIHITCGPDMKLEEFSQIGKLVTENIAMEAQVIIGARINKDFEGRVRVITIMTGVSSPYILGKQRIQDYGAQSTNQEFNELGIDYAFNYKKVDNLVLHLKSLAPEGYDLYFDNFFTHKGAKYDNRRKKNRYQQNRI